MALGAEKFVHESREITHAVTIQMLGPFSLRVNGQAVRQWKAGRARALLQYLLIHHDEPVDRGRLMNDLWPHGKSPETSLKVATHALRAILDSVSETSRSKSLLELLSYDHSCELRTGDVRIDWVEFQEAVQAAAAHKRAGRHEEALEQHAIAAARAIGGDLLDGESDVWLFPYREHSRDQALGSLQILMQKEMARGEDQLALNWGHQILAIDRCHEPAYRLIIRCHGRLGQPGRARHWFDVCQRILSCELGVSVHEKTRRALREAYG